MVTQKDKKVIMLLLFLKTGHVHDWPKSMSGPRMCAFGSPNKSHPFPLNCTHCTLSPQ